MVDTRRTKRGTTASAPLSASQDAQPRTRQPRQPAQPRVSPPRQPAPAPEAEAEARGRKGRGRGGRAHVKDRPGRPQVPIQMD